MTSTTSFNKWVIFKGALKRLKWFGILYTVSLILELPLVLWMQLDRLKFNQGALWAADKSFQPHMIFHPFAHLTNAAVAAIFGLIIFYYLHNDRANTFFHSLPIKRSVLYIQNLLAGLTLMWLPLLLNGILLYMVFQFFGITKGQWDNYRAYGPMGELLTNPTVTVSVWQIIGYYLFLSFLMTAFFFIFTVFVGMLTGNVLLQGALTFIGLFLPLGVYMLVQENFSRLLYGFPREMNNKIMQWLSPLVNYVDNRTYGFIADQIKWYLVYLAAAVILAGMSIYLYKVRHAEAAGETLASGWIRWIFKYGVALCAALTGGLYFGSLNENNPGLLYAGYIVGGLLGYCISDMIAYKSFYFYKRWKGLCVFGLVFLMVLGIVRFDILGYEKYVPAQNEVKAVIVSNLVADGYGHVEGDLNIPGMTLPENIDKVRELHRQIISREQENKAMERSLRKEPTMGKYEAEFTQRRIVSLNLTYVLQNGSRVSRVYRIDINSYRQNLSQVFNTQEAKKSMYSRFLQINTDKLDQINIHNYHLGRNIRIYKKAELNEAMAALKKDILNVSYEEAVEGKVPSKASIEFNAKANSNGSYSIYNMPYYQSFTNFEDVLKKYDYLNALFLKPEQVSRITLKDAGTGATVEVRDKQQIKLLLDWCNITDEQAFLLKQPRPEKARTGMGYFGKIWLNNEKSIFITFDGSPYAQQQVKKIFAH
jgi:ABC-2 type transport system permease protein